LYTGAGAEKFGLFEVATSTQILPSHSDLLDILAQGGVIGILLFSGAIFRIALYVYRHFNNRPTDTLQAPLVAHFHWIAVSCICTLPVIAFNPIVLQPGKAFVTWLNLGILIGIAMRCHDATIQQKQERNI